MDERMKMSPKSLLNKKEAFQAFRRWSEDNGEYSRRSQRWVTGNLLKRGCKHDADKRSGYLRGAALLLQGPDYE